MSKKNYLAIVNGSAEIELTNSEIEQLDAVQTPDGQYHILYKGKSYKGTIVSNNKAAKEISLKVNGKTHTVKLQDDYDRLVKKMGLSANVVHKISTIKAPMPGLVLNILVEPGQEVVHGEPMLILEAMKMENVIKSPGEGKVKRVVVSKGKAVDKGEVLIEME